MERLEEKRKRAERIVNKYAASAAGTALVTGPIPGTSVLLTGIEATMTYHVARVYGFNPTLQEAGATIAALVAASGGLKYLTVEASTMLPIFGWFVMKPAIAVGMCKAVGKLAIGHYQSKAQEASS